MISLAFIKNAIELINPLLTFLGLILAISLNIIGVIIVLRRKN